VAVYKVTDCGGVAPTRLISGALTTLFKPDGVVVTSDTVVEIPTLSQWMLIILSILLGFIAYIKINNHCTSYYKII